jgi:hypothetical protein
MGGMPTFSPGAHEPQSGQDQRAPRVFLSYSSKDLVTARELCRVLESNGYDVWMAPDSIAGADPWVDQILTAIQDCPCMVVLLSENATASRHVAREVSLALESNKGVIPVRITPAQLTGTLNYLLHLVQWVDVFPPPVDRHSSALLLHLARAFKESASADSVGRQQQDGQRSEGLPGSRRKVSALVGASVLAFAAVGGALLYSRSEISSQPVSNAVSTTTTPATHPSTVPTSTSTPTDTPASTSSSSSTTLSTPPDPQAVALAALRALRAEDLPNTPLTGQWIAQLASKTPGIVDPKQTTARGDHTFSAADILDEHQKARENPVYGTYVRLLLSTDYGTRHLHKGKPLWVTFAAVPGFSSAEDVRSWCAQQFPTLTGSELTDSCTPGRLEPPG